MVVRHNIVALAVVIVVVVVEKEQYHKKEGFQVLVYNWQKE